jgi:hypothetical protein
VIGGIAAGGAREAGARKELEEQKPDFRILSKSLGFRA